MCKQTINAINAITVNYIHIALHVCHMLWFVHVRELKKSLKLGGGDKNCKFKQ